MIMSVAFLLRAAFVHSPMPLAFLRDYVLKHMVSLFDQSEESIDVTQLYQYPLASLRHCSLGDGDIKSTLDHICPLYVV
jgi:hypothetical protein